MKKAILHFATPDYGSFAAISLASKKLFAKKYGYDVIAFDQIEDPSRAASWSKIPIIHKTLSSGYDVVWWVDADAVMLAGADPLAAPFIGDIGIAEISQSYTSEVGLHMNFGSVIFKNTANTLEALQRIWDNPNPQTNPHWWEQAAFHELIAQDPNAVELNMYPAGWINCISSEKINPTTAVYHLPGKDVAERTSLLFEAAKASWGEELLTVLNENSSQNGKQPVANPHVKLYNFAPFNYVMELDDRVDEHKALMAGNYETSLLQLIDKLIAPGVLIAELGSSIGYWTLMLSRLIGPEGEILSFESDKAKRTQLRKHLAMNGYFNVTSLPGDVAMKQYFALKTYYHIFDKPVHITLLANNDANRDLHEDDMLDIIKASRYIIGFNFGEGAFKAFADHNFNAYHLNNELKFVSGLGSQWNVFTREDLTLEPVSKIEVIS